FLRCKSFLELTLTFCLVQFSRFNVFAPFEATLLSYHRISFVSTTFFNLIESKFVVNRFCCDGFFSIATTLEYVNLFSRIFLKSFITITDDPVVYDFDFFSCTTTFPLYTNINLRFSFYITTHFFLYIL
ncbi:hypothetical protein JOC86_005016, partial [Bacillus pakistanensis]|nr:hypothetical protein [Bacillus pakistanensis]